MDLASAADVAAALGLESEDDLSDSQTVRLPQLLAKASHLFRRAAGRQFTEAAYVQRIKVEDGRVRLPEGPVAQVDSVVDDSGNAVEYTQSGDWLTVTGHHTNVNSFVCYQPPGGSGWFVTVAYTGGGVPQAVTAAVAETVAAALSQDAAVKTGARRVEKTAGPFSMRVEFSDGAKLTLALSDEDRALAESFRYPGTKVIVQRP